MRKASKAKLGKARDRYLDLVMRFPLRPLRSSKDLDEASAMIHRLLDCGNLDEGEKDYLDVLSDLVAKYEEEHHPIPPASDADMIRFFLDLRDLNQAELARRTKIAESTISAVLSGKRRLNRLQIGILAEFFQVDPGVFSFSPGR